jgi:hypothetical protein
MAALFDIKVEDGKSQEGVGPLPLEMRLDLTGTFPYRIRIRRSGPTAGVNLALSYRLELFVSPLLASFIIVMKVVLALHSLAVACVFCL